MVARGGKGPTRGGVDIWVCRDPARSSLSQSIKRPIRNERVNHAVLIKLNSMLCDDIPNARNKRA